MNWITRKLNPVDKSTISKTRKNSNVGQNNPTNIMNNSTRRNSAASDPGLNGHPNTKNTTLKKINANKVFSTTNWLNRRPNTKNTTLKNIRSRIKAKNAAALTRFLNQKPKPPTVLPRINTPKMAKPSIFQNAKNRYNSTKFSFQKKQHENAGMNLLTANLNNPTKTNNLHPSYTDKEKNYDPNLNSINAKYTRSLSTGVAGASFVQ